MFKAWLEACPWDVTEQADATLLDRLLGEIGVAGLTIPVVVPPMKVFRTRGREVVPFITNGGLAFRPSERGSLLSKGLREGDFVGEGDPLARCVEACQDRKLELRLLVDIEALGHSLNDAGGAACMDAFRQPERSRICPSHEAIAAHLRSLVEEIARRYEPSSIELVGMDASTGSPRTDDRWGVPISGVTRSLLDICFCDACFEAARKLGESGQAAATEVQRHLRAEMIEGKRPPSTPDDALVDSLALRDYLSAIGAARSELIKTIKGNGAPALVLRIADRDRRVSARDLPALAQAESAVVFPSASPADRLPETVAQTSCALHVGPSALRHPDPARLVALMKDAAAASYTGVEMSHLAACNDSAWDAIRQALRIARRKDM